jgi:transcriptional regulator with XRE-family HTH domain
MSGGSAASRRRSRALQVAGYVARRVRELRLAGLVTQEELAANVGVKRESISRYEGGERAISTALLLDIAAALGQPLAAFLPPADSQAEGPLTEIVAALHERPNLIPSVQDLLAALSEDAE